MGRILILLLVTFLSLVMLTSGAEAVDVYFSPGATCEDHVVGAIEGAKHEIHAVLYAINSPRIIQALVMAYIRGVDVKILTDKREAQKSSSGAPNLRNAGIELRTSSGRGLEHNSFAVFDEKLAMNGSYNWTEGGSVNSENCAVMSESNVVTAFERRFLALWSQDGATKENRLSLAH